MRLRFDAHELFSAGYIQGFWEKRRANMKVCADEVEWAFLLSAGAGAAEFREQSKVLTQLLDASMRSLPPPEYNPPIRSQEYLRAEARDAAFQGRFRGFAHTPSWVGERVSRERTLARLRLPQITEAALSLAQTREGSS